MCRFDEAGRVSCFERSTGSMLDGPLILSTTIKRHDQFCGRLCHLMCNLPTAGAYTVSERRATLTRSLVGRSKCLANSHFRFCCGVRVLRSNAHDVFMYIRAIRCSIRSLTRTPRRNFVSCRAAQNRRLPKPSSPRTSTLMSSRR